MDDVGRAGASRWPLVHNDHVSVSCRELLCAASMLNPATESLAPPNPTVTECVAASPESGPGGQLMLRGAAI